jgi:hypothetical protein
MMAKGNKKNIVQFLSPEKYIQTKARSLPIYKCWINENWKEIGSANVFVARRHITGNLTVGFYYVDLYCRGICDTIYAFNITEEYFHEMLADEHVKNQWLEIDYALAHNIIFAALEFAGDYEFRPHKDFAKVSQYILEEDNDDVELIEIECGFDGKPFYLQRMDDDKHQVKKILEQLERTAGPGNYDFALSDDVSDEDFDKDSHENFFEGYHEDLYDKRMGQDEEEWFNKYESWPLDKMIGHLISMMKNYPNINEGSDDEDFNLLIETIAGEITDDEEIEKMEDFIWEEFEDIQFTDSYPEEMLALSPGDENKEELEDIFTEIDNLITTDLKKAKSKLKIAFKKFPENRLLRFLELTILLNENATGRYLKLLKRYYAENPDYPLIKILWSIYFIVEDQSESAKEVLMDGRKRFFADREKLHNIEAYFYFLMLSLLAGANLELDVLETIDYNIPLLFTNENIESKLMEIIDTKRMDCIFDYIKENHADLLK